jgi:hypothetical protein
VKPATHQKLTKSVEKPTGSVPDLLVFDHPDACQFIYNIPMTNKLIPIYTTAGDLGAYLCYPFLYNPQGEWIGSVTPHREVYSVLGNYVGMLTKDPRILRRRTYDFSKPRRDPPAPQPRIAVPATVPLAPLMAELPYTMIDVLEDEPERLSTVDFDELREDMD